MINDVRTTEIAKGLVFHGTFHRTCSKKVATFDLDYH